jgi:hypothetical protein
MAVVGSRSTMSVADTSSTTPSISDLDAYNFREFQFPSASNFSADQDDEFGFDPPAKPVGDFTVYSPPDDFSSQWPDFDREDDLKPSTEMPINLDAFEMEKYTTSTLPNTKTAASRFGQMTPPRSSSAASTVSKEDKLSPKSVPADAKKRRKSQLKDEEAASTSTGKTTTSGRKRKSSRKASAADEPETAPGDQKRKQSLEKNRLAAAKCRVNKKEKTERLQRDSHDKAVENAYLKDQIMRMKDEIQQMNAILVAHANCKGCKSPEEIQAHLNALGNDFFNQQLAMANQNFGDFSQMDFAGLPALPNNFFSGMSAEHMLHPPLPEFNRTAEFEVLTPLPTG